MMKQNACFKDDGGLCVDVLLKNSNFSVMKTNSFETGLSDYRHTIYTILKTKFGRFELKKSIYRNFKQYEGGQIYYVVG